MTDKVELSDNQHEYDAMGGQVYVTILAAVEKEHWECTEDGYGSQRVKTIHPRVMIRTSPEQHWDDTTGFVKVRGRQYSAWNYVTPAPEYETWDGRKVRWVYGDEPHHGGYRNDQGRQLDRESKARIVLRDMEAKVLERFEVMHPDWRRTSERLRLEEKLSDRQCEAGRVRAELLKLHDEANQIAELLKSYV